jgi:hypothetical protein
MKIFTKYPNVSILFVVTLVYSTFLTGKPTVNPDAQIIIKNLESWKSLSDYTTALLTFQTIDFQPLRDLSFFVDMYLFQKFQLNTFVVQNIIWWVFSCITLFKIFEKLFPQKNRELILLLVIGFSIYPLFSYVVSWGMARKHIMAFFFILVSMNTLLKNETLNLRNSLKISLYYFLSVISQPVSLLLSFWFIYYLLLIRRTPLKEIRIFIFITILLQAFLTIINYRYYTSSNVFLFHYAPKTTDLLEIGDKVLALGHYHFQIFFPYLLSFNYTLGDVSVIIGLGFLILFYFFVYRIKLLINYKIFLLLPAALTFVIFLSTPHHLFDTYLLFPAFSVLCLFIYLLPKTKFELIKGVTVCCLVAWGYYTHIQTRNWLDSVSLTKSSFDRRPSCKSALNYSRMSYEAFQSPSAEVKKYLTIHECLKNLRVTKYDETTHSNFLSYVIFHENFFNLNDKILKLNELAERTILASLTKVALLIQNGKLSEADKELNLLIFEIDEDKIPQNQFHSITAKIVHPYCLGKDWRECLRITSKFINTKPKPYL